MYGAVMRADLLRFRILWANRKKWPVAVCLDNEIGGQLVHFDWRRMRHRHLLVRSRFECGARFKFGAYFSPTTLPTASYFRFAFRSYLKLLVHVPSIT